MWEFIINPWPWWVSGAAIAFTMFALLLFGRSFRLSSNLRTLCAIATNRQNTYFHFNRKKQALNLVYLAGAFVDDYLTCFLL